MLNNHSYISKAGYFIRVEKLYWIVFSPQAAFRGNTLGLPKYPDQQSMQQIDKEVLQTYLRSYYTPDRMVLAGVGVDHDALCELADKYFTG